MFVEIAFFCQNLACLDFLTYENNVKAHLKTVWGSFHKPNSKNRHIKGKIMLKYVKFLFYKLIQI